MKKIYWAGGILPLVLTLTFVAVSPAQSPDENRTGPPTVDEEFGEQMATDLRLSDDQKDRIRDLREGYKNDNADALERARGLRTELRERREKGERPSREEMEALRDQYGRPFEELGDRRRHLRDQVRDQLTPEQRRNFGRRMSARRSHGRRGEEMRRRHASERGADATHRRQRAGERNGDRGHRRLGPPEREGGRGDGGGDSDG